MDGVLDTLLEVLPKLSTKLAVAARFTLDNPDKIALNSMRTVASECGVASPTMLRLARKCGFPNYIEFRAAFQKELIGQGFSSRANILKNPDDPDGKQDLIAQISQAAHTNIALAFQNCDLEVLKEMANVLLSARTTYVIGSGSAHWLAAFLQATGRMALPELRAPRSGDAPIVEVLANIGPDDAILALGFSPYAKRTVDVVKFAKERGVKVMTMTDRRSSPLLAYSDISLLAPSQSPHFFPSMIAPLAMIEALLAMTVAESGPITLKRISRIEKLREEIGEYMW